MANTNYINTVGRLGNDREIFENKSEEEFINFSLALSVPPAREGEDWGVFWCSVSIASESVTDEEFDKLVKGAKVEVSGGFRLEEFYKKGSKTPSHSMRIYADDVKIIEKKETKKPTRRTRK